MHMICLYQLIFWLKYKSSANQFESGAISSNFKLPVSYSALKNGNSQKWELLLHVMLET